MLGGDVPFKNICTYRFLPFLPFLRPSQLFILSPFQSENQLILKAINPEYSWEGLMLKLKHQYFGHLM